jgi:dolichyl-diphosphooligosaccharide---protein glycosyltransferase
MGRALTRARLDRAPHRAASERRRPIARRRARPIGAAAMGALAHLAGRSATDTSQALLSPTQREALLRTLILSLICAVSFAIRLFSVLRYESIIHEFDPWFNFRATKVLVDRGAYAFWNWFDHRSWYPLGRIVGGTVYPGIMATAAFMHRVLNAAGFRVNIREVCVLTAPTFSALTALSAFALTRECADTSAGILAAAIISIVPGYISRSVAGSYDNEGVAITAMIFTFYMWTKAVVTGSLLWAAGVCLAYLYMVSTWGGYIFLINVIPVYVLVMLVTGRYSHRLYVAYSTFYVVGTLLSMQIRFVGFNAVQTPEHLGAFGVFGIVNLYCVANWVRSFAGTRTFNAFVRWLAALVVALVGAVVFLGAITGLFNISSGRILTLLDPTYATKHIAIVASVSEHQPTAWGAYFFDLHLTAYLMPLGLYFCFKDLSDANLFLVVYGVFSAYFSGVMVRLMLVLAPAAAMLSAIGVSASLRFFMRSLKVDGGPPTEVEYIIARARGARGARRGSSSTSPSPPPPPAASAASSAASSGTGGAGGARRRKGGGGGGGGGGGNKDSAPPAASTSRPTPAVSPAAAAAPAAVRTVPLVSKPVAGVMALGTCVFLFQYVRHSIWATSEAYSSPSVVLSARGRGGERIFFDDYRAGYYWLRQNTEYDAKVMSWWDYGYQISGMGDRTVIVDNNTWNNSHIATVGKAMNSPEETAYKIARKLDVDYVLVIFGGVVGYSSDDINKFLWMVRIASSVDGTVSERDYLSAGGGYTVGETAGAALRKSLMYRLCYYRFDEVVQGGQAGLDRVRQLSMAGEAAKIKLRYFEEAFTSENWIVRIYRVKKPDNRGFV